MATLIVEALEERWVPSASTVTPLPAVGAPAAVAASPQFAFNGTGNAGAFFLDGNNQIWQFLDNGKFTNTGGYALTISAGRDAAGNPELWFLDGNNQLWRYDNGTFFNTGGFATRIVAGSGAVFFLDGA